ncbi:cysteine-rich and transmembrane domain-containing protein PCC1-like isoform X1 [Arabidopsis lyrata subsp. lyrata]|uniref:cysteine-rich and transmembrane domain-containing protein PCC1-like isoform X1 n=1 Tax=Arabidopsis lyrata subsp. lyrata TaxID=81972 RepID=UPI000A29D250|nr:cysteine-rich and transmembrane domain-containing protein PCC1-like isoform X1 [Arabidopsis lyrata subsp. lyrata]|eukprot:XP_020886735.1 cysteine-rich and transmembrane domain-containing protein PCC1-like isoform X1 [Arabidopsis lyrata subsp. lyrata]
MDQYDHKYFSVQKPSQTSSGPYISPPPIGYPTRDKAVGDPPAAAVKTNSKGCCEVVMAILHCIQGCGECFMCCASGFSG